MPTTITIVPMHDHETDSTKFVLCLDGCEGSISDDTHEVSIDFGCIQASLTAEELIDLANGIHQLAKGA